MTFICQVMNFSEGECYWRAVFFIMLFCFVSNKASYITPNWYKEGRRPPIADSRFTALR